MCSFGNIGKEAFPLAVVQRSFAKIYQAVPNEQLKFSPTMCDLFCRFLNNGKEPFVCGSGSHLAGFFRGG